MKNKKVSLKDTEVTILIPTFNRSGYVQEAIDSALKQTYPCNVIVCDHGSTDDTPKVMKKYKDRVQYVRKEEDFGPHFCWLDGVLHAKTEYIKILFDDDLMEPTFVEKTLTLMHEDVGCVITNAKIIFDNGNKTQIRKSTLFNKTGVFRNSLIKRDFMIFTTVISPSSCLFRKREVIDGIYQGGLWKKGGIYYHGVGPDIFIMLLGLLRYKKVGFVNEELATFRAHEKSISIDANKNPETMLKIRKSYEDVVEFYLFLTFFKLFEIIYLVPIRFLRKGLILSKNLIRGVVKW
jgi:glycosyltransferase involved in cell wall biosynthesis